MEEKEAHFKTYLSCHVCLETSKDPVSLSCSHSFCSSCLRTFWEQTKIQSCPICKRKSSKGLPVNFGLKEPADSFAGRQKPEPSERMKETTEQVVCSKHPEEPGWFCEDEQRAVCPVCDVSHHQTHKVVPVEEAVRDLKEQLKSLQDKRDKYKQAEDAYNEMSKHITKQRLSTETRIRAEFNKLHQFLKEEEESRLAALREEEETKGKAISREIRRIQEQMSSLSDSISAVEEELQKQQASFLSSYKDTQSRARAQSSLSDPRLLSGALIDVAQHLGNLSFRVWEKMKDEVHFSPVILDPNTANGKLRLSDDLTSVRYEDTRQKLPGNPRRHTKYTDVFGSEGFSSGKHSWEVEVGDHPVWNVGLAKESVDRKGKQCPASPQYGFWCLCHHDEEYTYCDDTIVPMQKNFQRIRVQLDYDRGEVSFYSSEDRTHIYTYRDTFTEKLFPYFYVGKSASGKTADIKVCPSKVSLRCSEM